MRVIGAGLRAGSVALALGLLALGGCGGDSDDAGDDDREAVDRDDDDSGDDDSDDSDSDEGDDEEPEEVDLDDVVDAIEDAADLEERGDSQQLRDVLRVWLDCAEDEVDLDEIDDQDRFNDGDAGTLGTVARAYDGEAAELVEAAGDAAQDCTDEGIFALMEPLNPGEIETSLTVSEAGGGDAGAALDIVVTSSGTDIPITGRMVAVGNAAVAVATGEGDVDLDDLVDAAVEAAAGSGDDGSGDDDEAIDVDEDEALLEGALLTLDDLPEGAFEEVDADADASGGAEVCNTEVLGLDPDELDAARTTDRLAAQFEGPISVRAEVSAFESDELLLEVLDGLGTESYLDCLGHEFEDEAGPTVTLRTIEPIDALVGGDGAQAASVFFGVEVDTGPSCDTCDDIVIEEVEAELHAVVVGRFGIVLQVSGLAGSLDDDVTEAALEAMIERLDR